MTTMFDDVVGEYIILSTKCNKKMINSKFIIWICGRKKEATSRVFAQCLTCNLLPVTFNHPESRTFAREKTHVHSGHELSHSGPVKLLERHIDCSLLVDFIRKPKKEKMDIVEWSREKCESRKTTCIKPSWSMLANVIVKNEAEMWIGNSFDCSTVAASLVLEIEQKTCFDYLLSTLNVCPVVWEQIVHP